MMFSQGRSEHFFSSTVPTLRFEHAYLAPKIAFKRRFRKKFNASFSLVENCVFNDTNAQFLKTDIWGGKNLKVVTIPRNKFGKQTLNVSYSAKCYTPNVTLSRSVTFFFVFSRSGTLFHESFFFTFARPKIERPSLFVTQRADPPKYDLNAKMYIHFSIIF